MIRDLLAHADIVASDTSVHARSEEGRVAEQHGRDGVARVRQGLDGVTREGAKVPQARGLVVPARGEEAAVDAVRQAVHRGIVPAQTPRTFARRDVPEKYCAITAAAGKFVIGRRTVKQVEAKRNHSKKRTVRKGV